MMTSRMTRQRRGAERARRLLDARVELLGRGHHGEDGARDREVDVADEQAGHRVGEHERSPETGLGDVADQSLPAREHDHHEADHHAGEGERQGQQRHERPRAPRSGCASGTRRRCPRSSASRPCRRGERHRRDEARQVARLGQHRARTRPSRAAAAADDEQVRAAAAGRTRRRPARRGQQRRSGRSVRGNILALGSNRARGAAARICTRRSADSSAR